MTTEQGDRAALEALTALLSEHHDWTEADEASFLAGWGKK